MIFINKTMNCKTQKAINTIASTIADGFCPHTIITICFDTTTNGKHLKTIRNDLTLANTFTLNFRWLKLTLLNAT